MTDLANEILHIYLYAAICLLLAAGITAAVFIIMKMLYFATATVFNTLRDHFELGKEFRYFLQHRREIRSVVAYYEAMQKDIGREIREGIDKRNS